MQAKAFFLFSLVLLSLVFASRGAFPQALDASVPLTLDAPLGFETLPMVDSLPTELDNQTLGAASTTKTQKKSDLTLDRNSLITTWLRLAATGRSQSEIESMLKGLDPGSLETLKEELRIMVLLRLEQRSLKELLEKARDRSETRDIQRLVRAVVAAYSLEVDDKVREQIRQKFGYLW